MSQSNAYLPTAGAGANDSCICKDGFINRQHNITPFVLSMLGQIIKNTMKLVNYIYMESMLYTYK